MIKLENNCTYDEALQKLMNELNIGLKCEENYSEKDALKTLKIDKTIDA